MISSNKWLIMHYHISLNADPTARHKRKRRKTSVSARFPDRQKDSTADWLFIMTPIQSTAHMMEESVLLKISSRQIIYQMWCDFIATETKLACSKPDDRKHPERGPRALKAVASDCKQQNCITTCIGAQTQDWECSECEERTLPFLKPRSGTYNSGKREYLLIMWFSTIQFLFYNEIKTTCW